MTLSQTFFFVAAVALAWALGAAIVLLCWRSVVKQPCARFFAAALALPIGLGVTACVQLASTAADLPTGLCIVCEVVMLALLSARLWLTRSSVAISTNTHTTDTPELADASAITSRSPFVLILIPALLITLTLLAIASVGIENRQPHGRWDAWAIWNLKARFLYHSGAEWARPLLMDASAPSHPDYPLLLPLTASRFWLYLSSAVPAAPAMLARLLFVTLIASVGAAIAWRSNIVAALLAALTLAATPALLNQSMSQYADLPLSLFIFLTVALLTIRSDEPASPGRIALAGLCAGFAAMTKNEGQLFFVVTLFVAAAHAFWQQNLRVAAQRVSMFVLGAALPLSLVLLQKLLFAGANDVLAAQTTSDILSRITDPHRHALILSFITGVVWLIPDRIMMALLLLYAIVAGVRRDRATLASAAPAVSVVALMACGYYCVLLITPHDLKWHLSTSIDRLFMHLWPVVVFTFFLLVRSSEAPLKQST